MIDVRKDLEDVIKIYTDAETHLKKKEEYALQHVRHQTTEYLNVFHEREKMSHQIRSVQRKLDLLDKKSEPELWMRGR